MVSLYPRLWQVVLGLSLVLALIGLLTINANLPLYLAAILILFIGIPHGAADHRLFQQLYQKVYGQRALFLFYLGYLGLMGVVFLGWYLFPVLTLLLFLILSAYHFGQGNFAYLEARSILHYAVYLLWGSWVIIAPILWHFPEAQPVLESLLGFELSLPQEFLLEFIPLVLLAVVQLLLLFLKSALEPRYFRRELASLLVLSLVFYFAPLFLGFAIYFALWHALPSALDQIRFLFKDDNQASTKQYILTALPFSGMAILGIAAVVLIQPELDFSAYWTWLFAFVAALTLPHMLLLDRVYERLAKHAETN
ncbi:MAG: Brp/Blh family beta-carotene 15,15'-dioxygenase [Bacteroidota bacterium]